MSSGVLDTEQIAALVEAARKGELPADVGGAAARRPPRLRKVNFERPTKFTPDQERRFDRLMEAFCRTASTRLSAELRTPVELELIASTQLTWSATQAQVPDGSVCAIIAVTPIDTHMLMTAELPFVLCALESLLGAPPQPVPRERGLTEIDWALGRRLFSSLLHQLSIIWQDVAGVQLEVASMESSLENVQVAALSEPTLTLTVEARIGGTSSTLSLHVPYAAIAHVGGAFSQRDGAVEPEPGAVDAVDAALRAVQITMRAEVAGTLMTVERLLALEPGDVVILDRLAADGVTIFADAFAVHRAKPGRSGARRAVQILGPSPGRSPS
ncbi:MAG: FliM/FliN family flagellar motor switch protein [Solirubrobacteraceae bacterium]|nr:FliM/FliN family flagellar motor switch protein [Solirubrobacteraceae bacterium]